MNLPDALSAESAALEAHGIQTISVCVPSRHCLRKWQHVLGNRCPAAYKRIGADVHEVVYRTQSTHRGPFVDGHMAAQGRGIRQDHVIPDDAVVRNMRIRHDQHVVANRSQLPAFDRSAIDGHELANYVMVSDLQPCWFPGVTEVLRRHTKRGERKYAIVGSDSGRSLDHHMRNQ